MPCIVEGAMSTRLVVALLNYGLIVFLFLQALIDPVHHLDFIYSFGVFVFVAEFLSIHSGGALSSRQKLSTTIFVISIYIVLALGFSIGLGSVYPALILILSIIAKAATAPRSRQDKTVTKTPKDNLLMVQLVLLIGTVVFVMLFGWLLAIIIPFPEAVYAARQAGASGLFVEQPQTLLVWGILYYSLLAAWHIKHRPRRDTSTA